MCALASWRDCCSCLRDSSPGSRRSPCCCAAFLYFSHCRSVCAATAKQRDESTPRIRICGIFSNGRFCFFKLLEPSVCWTEGGALVFDAIFLCAPPLSRAVIFSVFSLAGTRLFWHSFSVTLQVSSSPICAPIKTSECDRHKQRLLCFIAMRCLSKKDVWGSNETNVKRGSQKSLQPRAQRTQNGGGLTLRGPPRHQ